MLAPLLARFAALRLLARLTELARERPALAAERQVALPARQENVQAFAAWPGAAWRTRVQVRRAAALMAKAASRGTARTLSRSGRRTPGFAGLAEHADLAADFAGACLRASWREAWNALPAMARMLNQPQRIAARSGSTQCIAEATTAATARMSVAAPAARRAFLGMGLPESSKAHHAQSLRRWTTRLGNRASAYVQRAPVMAEPIMGTSAALLGTWVGGFRGWVSGAERDGFAGRS